MFKQVVKFGIVGVVNTIIDFRLLNLLAGVFGWAVLWANTVSFSVAVINSFFFNKYWTFRAREGNTYLQLGGVVLVAVIGLGLSDLMVYYFSEVVPWHYNWAKLISIPIVFAWNFAASKKLVFKK